MALRIAPSVLAADFAQLGDQVRAAEAGGCDWIHIDVMDGHFVPNITMGPAVTGAIRRVTGLPLDVHLMIEEPDRFLEAFVEAGADSLTVHVEALPHLHRTLQRIRELGARAGVAINPATPLEAVKEVIPQLDLLLIMTVNPGFGGQRYIDGSEDRVARAREMLQAAGATDVDLQVDGGIDSFTIGRVVQAGADVVVAGSAVFGHGADIAGQIAALRASAGEGSGARGT